ncbi:MAG TPA: amino acid adenylation domain-containing protein, partial [Thermoanaerobaculia bacterium]|nr:amino acid adenylation domain-containing protein [Thermoanaerobaculia bacterium]
DFQIWLSEESTNELVAFSNGLGITLNTLLLGAWGLLLSRYSGRPDVLFGVVRTHRGPLAGESMIMGPVMNSVPFRASPSRRNDVTSYLQDVRSHWVDMRAGDFATAAEIRGWSELDPQAPFFETLVLFETHEFAERLRRQGGAWQNRSFLFFRQPRVPLSIYGYIEKRLSLKVIFDPGRFDAATMRRLLEHLRAVLEMLPAAANQPAADLPLLTAAESQQLLVEWNDTGSATSPSPVHRRFEEQARRAPHALAVSGPDGARTYGQLDERANRLAWLLAARGVGPGSVVAVLLERSVQETEALLAILKAGGAYLPLDGSAPERLDWILEDSGAALLLTGSVLDGLEEELSRQPASPPPVPGSPELPAYVIYTSGSTGRPKGVVVPHRGLANLVDWHLNAFGVTAADRASRLAGLGFDASVWELWPYWSAGAAILLPPEEIRADASALRDWMVREAVTIGFAPTPMAERLVELSWPPETALRLLLTGGDALRNAPPTGLPFRLVNNYGPTESSVVATSGPVAPLSGSEARGRVPGIGRPIGNLGIRLVDSSARAVPLGARGELTIAGPGLAQGYLGRPDLTAASFRPDPFGGPGERMYCTGDLARFLPDGQIEFLGRRDSQIKLRGFRIEPGEIEAAIDRHPSVQSCAILARGSGMDDDKQLVAFLVRRPGSPDGDIDLHGFLRGRLPAYMIPRLYTWIDSLPLNTSGKVDRKALEAAADAVSGHARDHVPPETPVERLLAQIWEDVLGHSPVGLRDDFFALGGSSLDVMQVLAALRNIFQRDIPADLVFVASTIEQLVPNLFPEAAERDDAERVAESTLQDVPG